MVEDGEGSVTFDDGAASLPYSDAEDDIAIAIMRGENCANGLVSVHAVSLPNLRMADSKNPYAASLVDTISNFLNDEMKNLGEGALQKKIVASAKSVTTTTKIATAGSTVGNTIMEVKIEVPANVCYDRSSNDDLPNNIDFVYICMRWKGFGPVGWASLLDSSGQQNPAKVPTCSSYQKVGGNANGSVLSGIVPPTGPTGKMCPITFHLMISADNQCSPLSFDTIYTTSKSVVKDEVTGWPTLGLEDDVSNLSRIKYMSTTTTTPTSRTSTSTATTRTMAVEATGNTLTRTPDKSATSSANDDSDGGRQIRIPLSADVCRRTDQSKVFIQMEINVFRSSTGTEVLADIDEASVHPRNGKNVKQIYPCSGSVGIQIPLDLTATVSIFQIQREKITLKITWSTCKTETESCSDGVIGSKNSEHVMKYSTDGLTPSISVIRDDIQKEFSAFISTQNDLIPRARATAVADSPTKTALTVNTATTANPRTSAATTMPTEAPVIPITTFEMSVDTTSNDAGVSNDAENLTIGFTATTITAITANPIDPLTVASKSGGNTTIIAAIVVLLVLGMCLLLWIVLCRGKSDLQNEIPAFHVVQNAAFTQPAHSTQPTTPATASSSTRSASGHRNHHHTNATSRGRSASTTIYAIPMEADGSGGASSSSASVAVAVTAAAAVERGEVMYVSALNQDAPEYAAADFSSLYSVVSKPTTRGSSSRMYAAPGTADDDVQGRYSGYAPPPGSIVEYATPLEFEGAGGGGGVHYDLAQQDSIENHYDLPAPGERRRRKKKAQTQQSDA